MAPPSAQDKKKNIEDQDWYHGFRPRKDAVRLIKEPGEFLVRATDNGPTTDIVITACDDNRKMMNITLRFDNGNWFIGQKSEETGSVKPSKKHSFPTIVELVEYYRVNKITRTLKLLKAIPKPDWMIKHENIIYQDKDKLGMGNFCSVYKGTLKRNNDSIIVAVKISLVTATASDSETEEAKEARKSMMQEAQLMSFYAHDNVIQFHGVACDHQPVLVVMEFCPGGDLLSHLIKHGKKTDDREKLIYLYEAGRGMNFLHVKKCVHRDLAARNCLISNTGKIKIADFGLSKVLEGPGKEEEEPAEDAAKSSNAQVPVRWMAPETLRKPPNYSMRSDVWAFGVMAYEVFSNGVKPWPDDPVKYVATQIRKGNMPKLPEGTPHKVVDMVSKMWNLDPTKRPAMRYIGRDFNALIKEAIGTVGAMNPEKMTINKINGVTRTVFFDQEADTSEFEDTGSTVENDSFDKVEKSGDNGRKRVKPSQKGPRRANSNREKKESSTDK